MVRRRRDEPHARGGVPHLGDPGVDLGAGELAALARLGALGHLDLELAGVDQVEAGHAEAPAGHLLDGRVLGVAVGRRQVARRVLAALAGVGLSADPVHGDGQRLVGLLGDGAVAHGAGLEPAHDGLHRLDLVERHRAGRRLELHEAAQRVEVARLVVDEGGVVLEGLEVVGAGGHLEPVHRLRVEEVVLAALAVLVLAARRQAAVDDGALGRVAALVAQPRLLGHHVDAHPAHPGGGPGEVLVDEVLVEADRLEDLGAVVALDGRDAHLGDDLDDALGDRLGVALLGLVGRPGDEAELDLVVDGLEDQVGVHRAGAVPDEGGEVVDLARLARLEHQAAAGAGPLPDEVVLHRRHRQERRDGGVVGVVAAVREDDDVVALGDALGDPPAQVLQGLAQAGAAGRGLEERRQRDGLEPLGERPAVEGADLLQLLVADDRRRQGELAGALRPRLEEVPLRPDRRLHRHDDLLADGVHRRVGHLGEELLEVAEEELRVVGEDRQRRVGAHGADGLGALGGHGVDEDLDVLRGVAEHLLAPQHALVIRLDDPRRLGQLVELHEVLVQPGLVGVLAGDALLELLVRDDLPEGGVDQEHAARLEPPLLHDRLGGQVEHAHLGGHDHQAVLGDVVARGAQAVAVQHRADADAVREGDGGRAVPGLHEAGVELVERLLVGAHGGVAGPGLGHHHHHGVRQLAPGQGEQLQHVVEHARVGAVGVDHREDLLQVGAEQAGAHHRLARVHPVDVAAQRVDLAVVRDVAVRVGARPGGEGVGGEARVDHRQRRDHPLLPEVRVELDELRGVQHALVDDGLVAERGDVEVGAPVDGRARHLLLHQPTDDVELALEGGAVEQPLAAPHEDLADDRLGGLGRGAQGAVVGGDVAPAEDELPLLAHRLLEEPLAGGPPLGGGRQEDHAHAVVAGAGQREAELAAAFPQEGVRHLDEDAGAVAGVLLGAHRAAVLQVDEHGERPPHGVVRGTPLDVDHEAEAAGVLLVPRIVEPLLRWIPGLAHLFLSARGTGLPPGARRARPDRSPRGDWRGGAMRHGNSGGPASVTQGVEVRQAPRSHRIFHLAFTARQRRRLRPSCRGAVVRSSRPSRSAARLDRTPSGPRSRSCTIPPPRPPPPPPRRRVARTGRGGSSPCW